MDENSAFLVCVSLMCLDLVNKQQIRQEIFRSCVPSVFCTEHDQTFSYSYDVWTSVASVRCCNTDGCNDEALPCKYLLNYIHIIYGSIRSPLTILYMFWCSSPASRFWIHLHWQEFEEMHSVNKLSYVMFASLPTVRTRIITKTLFQK